MNLGYLRSRCRIKLDDLDGKQFTDAFLNAVINEGLRTIAFETLILEASSSSLTYSSTYDGFGLPTDFIKVKYLRWTTAVDSYVEIEPKSLKDIYVMRNKYIEIDENSADAFNPKGYAINGGYIIVDSTTQTSPTLYYYKYDTALSTDANSPSFDSEHHKYLIDYVHWELGNDQDALARYNYGLQKIKASKWQLDGIRTQYEGL